MKTFLFVLFLSISVAAQDLPSGISTETPRKGQAILVFESVDAHQFGYDKWDKGFSATLSYRLSQWEPFISGSVSDGHKKYIGDGRHTTGSLGTRYFLNDSVFLTAGASVGHDKNSQYEKFAYRGFIGAGLKSHGFVGTFTLFAPPTTLSVDANQVRGCALLLERFQPVYKSLSLYGAFQGSLASFNQTGAPGKRYTAAEWSGRAGIAISF